MGMGEGTGKRKTNRACVLLTAHTCRSIGRHRKGREKKKLGPRKAGYWLFFSINKLILTPTSVVENNPPSSIQFDLSSPYSSYSWQPHNTTGQWKSSFAL